MLVAYVTHDGFRTQLATRFPLPDPCSVYGWLVVALVAICLTTMAPLSVAADKPYLVITGVNPVNMEWGHSSGARISVARYTSSDLFVSNSRDNIAATPVDHSFFQNCTGQFGGDHLAIIVFECGVDADGRVLSFKISDNQGVYQASAPASLTLHITADRLEVELWDVARASTLSALPTEGSFVVELTPWRAARGFAKVDAIDTNLLPSSSNLSYSVSYTVPNSSLRHTISLTPTAHSILLPATHRFEFSAIDSALQIPDGSLVYFDWETVDAVALRTGEILELSATLEAKYRRATPLSYSLTVLGGSSPVAVVSGQSFQLELDLVDAQGQRQAGYLVSSAVHATLLGSGETVPLTLLSSGTNRVALSVMAADGSVLELLLSDEYEGETYSSTVVLSVDVVASAVQLAVPRKRVPVNIDFFLPLLGVDAQGRVDVDYIPSAVATADAMPGSLGHFLQQNMGNALAVRLSGVGLGVEVMLSVQDGALFGMTTVTTGIVAESLAISVDPSPEMGQVLAGESLAFTLQAVNSEGREELSYPLWPWTLTASVAWTELGRTSNTLTARFSGLPDRTAVTLTASAGSLSRTLELVVDVEPDHVVLLPLSDSTELRHVSSAAGGAALDYRLWLENAQGEVDHDIDFSQLTAGQLAITPTQGSIVSATLSPSSSTASHIGLLTLRYWPVSDRSTFDLTVGFENLRPATVSGPVVDLVAERLVAVVTAAAHTDELYLEHGAVEHLTVQLQAVAGEPGCDDGIGQKVFPCVWDENGGRHSILLRHDSTASRSHNVQADFPAVSGTVESGQRTATLAISTSANLLVTQDVLGLLALTVEDVDSTGLAPAMAFVKVRLVVDFDLSQDAVESVADAIILLNSKMFSSHLLAQFPQLLLQGLHIAQAGQTTAPGIQAMGQSLDTQTALTHLRSIQAFLDITGDGILAADDALLILRYPELSDSERETNTEWILQALPYLSPDIEKVKARLQAIY